MENIQGTVTKIIYRKEENGFSIFRLESDNDFMFDDTITVKGTFFKLEEKEHINVFGEYRQNPTYGREFIANHYEICVPKRLDMLEKYLATGLIKGIGPVKAKAIVSHFGDESSYVMEHEPHRLAEVSGIGKRMAELIGKRMAERGEMQKILFQLGQYGINPNLGAKIFKKYKNNTLHVLQTNPYKLIHDIRGVGFGTADKIALENGVPKESEYRLQTGIQYVLESCSSFGNVYYPKDKLIKESSKQLDVSSELIITYLNQMIGRRDLILEEDDHVYTKVNYESETILALEIQRVINSKTKRKVDETVLKSLKGNLDEIQMGAVKTAACSNLMVLTGGPGVGKTTTTNLIIQYFEKKKKKIALAAPTGRAAKRMKEATGKDAKTIHRLLEVMVDEHGVCFNYDKENPLEEDIFVIDEVSMMDMELAKSLFLAIPDNAQVILVGDKNQLPSVGSGNVLADIITSQVCPVIELKKIYRQADGSHIIENAYKILNKEPLNLTNRSKDFFYKSCDDPEELKKLLVHYVADSLPAFTGESDIQVLCPLRKRALGSNELNIVLQNRLNPKKEVEIKGFREGDKVMQIVNDYNRKRFKEKKSEMGVFNGDVGHISKIDTEDEFIYVEFDDGWSSCYEYDDLDSLELAYAVTIHKSQGSEYPVVVIPIYDYVPMITAMNLIYTGVTRAKKTVMLIGSKKKLYQIINNTYTSERYTNLCTRLKNK